MPNTSIAAMSIAAITLRRFVGRLISVQTITGAALLINALYFIISYQRFQRDALSESITPPIYIFGDVPFYVMGLTRLITLVSYFLNEIELPI